MPINCKRRNAGERGKTSMVRKIASKAHRERSTFILNSLRLLALRQSFHLLCVLGLLPAVGFSQTQHHFPVQFKQATRVDQSFAAFPWTLIGSDTKIHPPHSQTVGCAGSYPDGAPARVSCFNPNSIIGPQYICTSTPRDTYVKEALAGQINIPLSVTSMTDGHNADSCVEFNVGTTEVRTKSDRLSLAGGRWACPAGHAAFDITGDGSVYGDEVFPYQFNPEACGSNYCPEGSALAFSPQNDLASLWFGSDGYTCVGTSEEKQPRECEDGKCPTPTAGDPIIVSTGNSFQTEEDFRSEKPGGLDFTRRYNSRGNPNVGGHFSTGWSHNYDVKIVGSTPYLDYTNSNALAHVTVIRSDGRAEIFISDSQSYIEEGENYASWSGESDNLSSTLVQRLDEDLAHTGWIYTSADDATEHYDVDGQLIQWTLRDGKTYTFHYDLSAAAGGDDDNRSLDVVTDFTGDSLRLSYDSQLRVSEMTDPAGFLYRYEYSAGNLYRVIYPDLTPGDDTDNPYREYHYENANFPGFLTGITDENGNRFVTWEFDSSGRAIVSELAGGVDRETLAYNGSGGVTVTNPLGVQTTYRFLDVSGIKVPDGASRTAPDSTPLGSESNTYDPFGYRTSHSDWNGNITQYAYDGRGLQSSRTEAVGSPADRTITTQWHPELRLPVEVAEPGRTTSYLYDSSGRVIARTETDTTSQSAPYSTNGRTRTWTYTYYPEGVDGAFQMQSMDGPRTDVNDTTTYAYTPEGFIAAVSNSLGQTTTVTAYNNRGLPLSMTDANGVVTNMSYHPRGWLLTSTVTDPGAGADAVTTYEYDDAGQMTRVTLPTGAFLSYEYDAAHRLTAINNNLSERQEFTLDDAGNITAEVIRNSGGSITRTQTKIYDELSRIFQVVGGANQVTEVAYDDNGNEISVVLDPSGIHQSTLQAFDALDRLSTVTDAHSNNSQFVYDARDNLVSVTDQRGLITTYIYDGLNNLIQLNSPDTGVTVYTYDDAGNQLSQLDARGVLTNYSYDELNRLVAVQYPNNPAENIGYVYDEPGGGYGVGRLTRINDQTGSTSYVYDHRGNQLQATAEILGNSYATQYAYDLADNMLQTVYPSGRIVNHQLDALGRTVAIETLASAGGGSQLLAGNIDYLPFGPMRALDYGNNLGLSISSDQDYRVAGISVTDNNSANPAILGLTYTQNAVDNISAIADSVDVNESQAFVYDHLNRLQNASGDYGDQAFTYDPVGNRLSLTSTVDGTTVTETYTYDPNSNRLLSVDRDGVIRGFQYDSNGNVISDDRGADTGFNFEYNEQNRLLNANPVEAQQ
ncbi:MAG: DUF6531 domain-containing protein [Pseudohongiellaceae bacterium]